MATKEGHIDFWTTSKFESPSETKHVLVLILKSWHFTSILPLSPAMFASLCVMTPVWELICATRLFLKYKVTADE